MPAGGGDLPALGAVPRVLVWDGEGAVGRWRAGAAELTAECQAFRGTLATKVIICRPADPEAKGLMERLHDYLERAFLPGPMLRLAGGLQHSARRCCRGSTPGSPGAGVRPTDRIDADGPRCWRCRRCRRRSGWRGRRGCRGITTCALDGNACSRPIPDRS